jgi:hypothetical protein
VFFMRYFFNNKLIILLLTAVMILHAEDRFESAPVNYSKVKPDNAISRLQKEIDLGNKKLSFEQGTGYLRSVLKSLGIPVESQTLVFSKTSLQARLISPRRPRALYFNDEVYIGWMPYSQIIEISAVDAKLGTVFYTLNQDQEKVKFKQKTDECFQCHASSRTYELPGHLLRSVYPDSDGQPIFRAGSYRTSHESPFTKRWGGWYVSGMHGWIKHMANVNAVEKSEYDIDVDRVKGANTDDLTDFFEHKRYLSAHSDIVAMMVQDHQVMMHNLLTQANFHCQYALYDQAIIDKALERKVDGLSDSSKRRIAAYGEKVIKYMLFCKEATMVNDVKGTTNFAKQFSARGKKDSKGRSLFQLDLKKRLLKYPCSYLIYTESFDKLPKEMKSYLYKRLWEILTGKDKSEVYANLKKKDNQAIFDILLETKTDLPDYWKK